MEFRTLTAQEIECRVATVKQNGFSILLYKDARCDMNILDETVGAMNWQRNHSRDNANCSVSIWDKEKQQWISKEDTGTESYTEKEKGLASDSFKRACFNWGIGRELYTAPFIWINPQNDELVQKNNKYTTYAKMYVKEIGYDDKRNINSLVIIDSKGNVRFNLNAKTPTQPSHSNQKEYDEVKELQKAQKELEQCKSTKDVTSIWNKYQKLHSLQTFVMAVKNKGEYFKQQEAKNK